MPRIPWTPPSSRTPLPPTVSRQAMGPSALPGRLLVGHGLNVTDELAECIRREATALLGDAYVLRSVHVKEGWGDIFWATVRIGGPRHDDHGDLVARLNSAVHRSLGEVRHVVKVEWEQP